MQPSEALTTSERLVLQGKYNEALANIEEIEKRSNLNQEDKVGCWILRIQIGIQKGEYEEAYSLCGQYLNLSTKFNNPLFSVDILFKQSLVLLLMGKQDESFQVLISCDEIIDNLDQHSTPVKQRKAQLLYRKGQHLLNENRLTEGLLYIQESLSIANEIDDKLQIAYSQYLLAAFSWLQGDLNNAITHYQQAMSYADQLNAHYYIANCLINIGEISHWRGEYTKALDYYNRALKHYRAIDGEQSVPFVTTLFLLINVLIDNQTPEEAQQYLNQILQIAKETDNRVIGHYSQLSKALILKQSPRIKEKVEAQELLKDLVVDETIFFDVKVIAMLYYSELLIEELKSYGAPEVLTQIKSLMADFHEFSQQERNPHLIVRTSLLQAKLFLIEGDIPKAEQLLIQAKDEAAQIGLIKLEKEIDLEIQQFREEINKWSVLVKQASLSERLEEAQIKKYIQDAQKIVHSFK